MLDILATWVINLRQPFFDYYEYDVFVATEFDKHDIVAVFDKALKSFESKKLSTASNMLSKFVFA